MTDWEPSHKQMSVLNAALECGYNRNISAICDEAGVARQTIYKWLRDDEGFKDAWENIWKRAIKRHLPGVVLAQLQKAQEGDTPAARFITELSGELRQRVEQTGKDGSPLIPPKLNIHLHGTEPSSS